MSGRGSRKEEQTRRRRTTAVSPEPLADRDARRDAAGNFAVNLVVTAGAGTGKTSLLVERFLNLVLSGRVSLEEVLAITFTEKATSEMRERLAEALEDLLGATAPADGAKAPGGAKAANGASAANGSKAAGATGGAPSTQAVPLTDATEAGRSLAWLLEHEGLDREELHRRVARTLDLLDTAAVRTIHSFCRDLLQRNALEAGIPLEFSVDEGIGQDLLFDRLWPEFLAEELGPEAPRADRWDEVLTRFSEQDIEEAARSLCRSPVACDLLAEEGYQPMSPLDLFGANARELHGRLIGFQGEIRNKRAMPEVLETLILLLDRFLERGPAGLRETKADSLPYPKIWAKSKSPSAGDRRRMGERGVVIEETVTEALHLVQGLRFVDEEATALLLEILAPFARRFRGQVRREGLLSHDDLLLLARNLLRDHPRIRANEAKRARAILVDEFQDTDPLQYEILFYLTAERPEDPIPDPYRVPIEPGRVFIVGDPKQSIYRFRGADMKAFQEAVDHVLSRGERRDLVTNFRSLPGILKAVNRLFQDWIGPRDEDERFVEPPYEALQPHRAGSPSSPPVEVWSVSPNAGKKAEDQRRAEARAIADFIQEQTDGSRGGNPSWELRDIAILLRSLNDAPLYTRALRDAGIDFVIDGGKAFVKRPEVTEALALLEAFANPGDPVATLAVLRSSLGGIPDAVLAEYAHSGGRFHWRAKLPDGMKSRFPAIARLFALLRRLDRETRSLPIDRRIQVLLTESEFLLPQAAYADGAQRTANIRRLAERAAGLARERGLTLEETIRHLDDEFTGRRNEGESPLADEAVNAVRVLTVHKAKGLEFRVVIVPDMSRGTRKEQPEIALDAFRYDHRRVLTVTMGKDGVQNCAFVLARHENARHENAERKRLFYVATTRARDRLILVNGNPSPAENTMWVPALSRYWGYEFRPLAPDGSTEPLADGLVLHRRIPEGQGVHETRRGQDLDPVSPARAFREAARQAGASAVLRFRTPSADRRAQAVETVPDSEEEASPRDRELARAVGNAVHHVLQHLDFTTPEHATEILDTVSAAFATEAGVEERALREEATVVLRAFLASALPARLASAEILGRELPILFRDEAGVTVHGYADLVYRLDGRVHVADYKTDREPPEEVAARYRDQLADYATAVARALALDEPPVAEILLLRRGERIEL